jgi:hypothetical protein
MHIKNKKDIFTVLLSVLVCAFLVCATVQAAITISGTTITLSYGETIANTTNGTITLSDGTNSILIKPTGGTGIDIGDATTTGIDIGTATTGINLTGDYTTGLAIGSTGTPMDLTDTATNKAVEIYTTSSSVTGDASVTPVYMKNTMTADGGVGGRAEFVMATEKVLGSWANALKGYTDFGDAGSVTGLASAVNAEMKMPDKVLAGGNYAPLEMELVFQDNGRTNGTPVSFIYARASEETTTGGLDDFNATGYLFNLNGLTLSAGNVLDTIGSTTPTHELRILIDGEEYFIMLQKTQ